LSNHKNIQKGSDYVIIRFNVELRDSQYKSYYNQKLIVLEHFAKLKQF